MEQFTRYEHQYILMLASRAKRDMDSNDPREKEYIEHLVKIMDKCKMNMNEQSPTE